MRARQVPLQKRADKSPGDYGDPCSRPPAVVWAGDADSPEAAEEVFAPAAGVSAATSGWTIRSVDKHPRCL